MVPLSAIAMMLTGANMKAEAFFKLILSGLFLFSSINAEVITLWDFGVAIKEERLQKPNDAVDSSEIRALISDPFVEPRKSTDLKFSFPIEILKIIPVVTEDNFHYVEKSIAISTDQY